MHFNFDTPFMEAFDELNKLEESLTTIRCMFALYEDDDGYVCKTGVYAGDLTTEEMEDLLTDRGMCYVQCWDEYDTEVSTVPQLGDVVDVFDVDDDDIADVAAISGKDPDEYKRVGFFESINEAADPVKVAASKKFWSEAKQNRMDEDSFHTAFDDELTELGLMDMFDARGVLENNYGRIKKAAEANPESWAIKALGKLWALRYSKNRPFSVIINNYFKSEKEDQEAKRKAAEEEKARKLEEQKRIRAEKLKKYQQLILTYLRKIDADTVDQYEDIIGVPALDGVTVDEVWVHESQWTDTLDQEYRVCIEGWNYCYKLKESKLNDEAYMLKTLKNGLDEAVGYSYYKEAVDEFKQRIDVLAVKNPKHTVLLLGESGTTYELEFRSGELRMSIDGEDAIPAQKIDEPYEVIYAVSSWANHSDRTTVDNEDGASYSWNSKYASMLGRRIPTSFGRKNGFMGTYQETTKLTKAQASSSDFCHADGIDSWAEYYSHETATD